MRHRFAAALATALAFSTAALAQSEQCQCLWQGSFVDTAAKADLVVGGTIIANKGNAADLSIEAQLKGKEFRETIRLWGDDGKQCRPAIDTFPVGSRWLFALKRIDNVVEGGFNPNTPNISYGRVGDYAISQCGANWLALHDGYASGNLYQGRRWEWTDEKMNPVLVPLIGAYLNGVIPVEALAEAAKPRTEARKLMEQTKQFLRQQ